MQYKIKLRIYDNKNNFDTLHKFRTDPLEYILDIIFKKIKNNNIDFTQNNIAIKNLISELLNYISTINQISNIKYSLYNLAKKYNITTLINLINTLKTN